MEKQVVAVIQTHPEYHALLENERNLLAFVAEEDKPNPFLHLGLHLVIRDQVSTNRPEGITSIYKQLHQHFASAPLEAEHFIMDHLGQCLWKANYHQTAPDYNAYLQTLQLAIDAL